MTTRTDLLVEGRGHNFFIVDNAVVLEYGPTIGALGVAVYAALAVHTQGKERTCFPSYARLARLLGLSRPTVIKTIQTLVDAGLITVEKNLSPGVGEGRNGPNTYTLCKVQSASGKPDLLVNEVNQLTTFTGVVKDVYPSGKGGLPEQDPYNKTQQQDPGGRTPPPKKRAALVATTVPANLIDTLFANTGFRAWVSANLPPVQEAAIRRELLKFTSWAEANDRTYKNWQAAAYKWLLGADWPPQKAAPLSNGHSAPRPLFVDDGAARRRAQRAATVGRDEESIEI